MLVWEKEDVPAAAVEALDLTPASKWAPILTVSSGLRDLTISTIVLTGSRLSKLCGCQQTITKSKKMIAPTSCYSHTA